MIGTIVCVVHEMRFEKDLLVPDPVSSRIVKTSQVERTSGQRCVEATGCTSLQCPAGRRSFYDSMMTLFCRFSLASGNGLIEGYDLDRNMS